MKSMLSQLLFDPIPAPPKCGRTVRFDIDEPDILLSTGSLEQRISTLMQAHGYPMTGREIAAGIGSNTSQVNRGLRVLIAHGQIEALNIPGSVKEYALK